MTKPPIWTRQEVDSPCVQVCVVHPTERICVGCYRTIDEISGWSNMDAATRQAVKDELPQRASRLVKRRGGRGARRPAH